MIENEKKLKKRKFPINLKPTFNLSIASGNSLNAVSYLRMTANQKKEKREISNKKNLLSRQTILETPLHTPARDRKS